jgi:hypothetical protein
LQNKKDRDRDGGWIETGNWPNWHNERGAKEKGIIDSIESWFQLFPFVDTRIPL